MHLTLKQTLGALIQYFQRIVP